MVGLGHERDSKAWESEEGSKAVRGQCGGPRRWPGLCVSRPYLLWSAVFIRFGRQLGAEKGVCVNAPA